MILLMVMFISNSAFHDAHFSSLPSRASALFSNPAGLGRYPGSEALFAYDPDHLTGGVLLGYGGVGVRKTDTTYRYETGVGYRLPGAFSFGYAYQFGDTSLHRIGVIGTISPKLTIGYTTTLGERMHMYYGISVMPFQRYLTVLGDIEYEGIDSILNYYYGAVLQPRPGLGLYIGADQDLAWRAGIAVSFGYVNIAGLYVDEDEKFSAGVLLSAQSYESIIPETRDDTYLDF